MSNRNLSFSGRRFLESHVNSEPAGRKSASSESLSTLNFMNGMKDMNKNNPDDPLTKVANETLKYHHASAGALASSSGLQSKYGAGASGMTSLSNNLKQRQGKRVFDSVMDTVLKTSDEDVANAVTYGKFNVDTHKKRINMETTP